MKNEKELFEKYNSIVAKLMQNDSNCSIDMLLQGCECDLCFAVDILKLNIKNSIKTTEGNEREFYIKVLKELE